MNKNSQSDSLGYNLVNNFLTYTYHLIKENKVILWDSPFRNHAVSFDNLTMIETNEKSQFTASDNFFIYEYWSSNKLSSSFRMVGFGFSTSSNNKEVSFGFIDFNEIVDYLKLGKLEYSINGYCDLSFYQVFMNKSFNFDLLYFDDKPIIVHQGTKAEKDYLKGLEIKNKAFGNPDKNLNHVNVIPCKTITYKINLFDYDTGSLKIFSTFINFYNEYKAQLRLLAGEDIYAMFKKNTLIITECTIEEVIKYYDNKPTFYLLDITPSSFGKPYYQLTDINLDTLNLYIDSVHLKDYILSKKYKLHLIKINGYPVNQAYTDEYLKQLFSGDLNHFHPELLK